MHRAFIYPESNEKGGRGKKKPERDAETAPGVSDRRLAEARSVSPVLSSSRRSCHFAPWQERTIERLETIRQASMLR
jgi:hypothetical protein